MATQPPPSQAPPPKTAADLDHLYSDTEAFRDTIATVDQKTGKRNWIYPKKPQGRFHRARIVVSVFLLAFLFGAPFIQVNGHPFMLLNVLERRFYLFGIYFSPQDFFLLGLGMIALVVGITLFTVAYGRIFCGWVCPQTIFMEMVFRKIEYGIEGDYNRQKALNRRAWDAEKITKKVLKHGLFYGIAFLIAHTFLAYIIGTEALLTLFRTSPLENMTLFIVLMAFTTAFYIVFAFVREQVCIGACPYGRLQGVLLDRNSIVVAYDHKRGEPRGKLRRGQPEAMQQQGDCIDCHQCVAVCPTGIDIRHGTQLECVNCTACIDACDSIMDRIGRPRGLIRYASRNQIEQGQAFRFTTRLAAYTLVLLGLVSVVSFLMFSRVQVDATILRIPGMLYKTEADGTVLNVYQYKFINKTDEPMQLLLELVETDGRIELSGHTGSQRLDIAPRGKVEGNMIVFIEPEELEAMKTTLTFRLVEDGQILKQIDTSFMGPAP